MRSKANLIIQTNGINLIKYYDALPMHRFERFIISLDGDAETHLKRRFSDSKDVDSSAYYTILAGIRRLLDDNYQVEIRSSLDAKSYKQYPDFMNFLRKEGFTKYPNFSYQHGVICDMSNKLGIDPDFNNKEDITLITNYLIDHNIRRNNAIYIGLQSMSIVLAREHNTFVEGKTHKCDARLCSNYYFSPNGNVYFCDCVDDKKAIVGTFYPDASFNDELIRKLEMRNPIFTQEKCKPCAYKYVCIGGCPQMAMAQDSDVACGAFCDEEILDKLVYMYPTNHINTN